MDALYGQRKHFDSWSECFFNRTNLSRCSISICNYEILCCYDLFSEVVTRSIFKPAPVRNFSEEQLKSIRYISIHFRRLFDNFVCTFILDLNDFSEADNGEIKNHLTHLTIHNRQFTI